MSFETTYTNRRTRDILEDYDLALYADRHRRRRTPTPDNQRPRTVRSGSASTTSATRQNPGSNFVIATLEGGKRTTTARPDLPQALQRQLAGARARTPTTGPTATRTPTRTPTSRATCSTSIRARRTQYARQPGNYPARLQVRGLVHDQHRRRARRAYRWYAGTYASRTALDYRPQPADPGRGRRTSSTATTEQLDRGRRGRVARRTPAGASSTCARSTSTRFDAASARSSSWTSSTCSTTRTRSATRTSWPAPAARLRRAASLPGAAAPLLPGRAPELLDDIARRDLTDAPADHFEGAPWPPLFLLLALRRSKTRSPRAGRRRFFSGQFPSFLRLKFKRSFPNSRTLEL